MSARDSADQFNRRNLLLASTSLAATSALASMTSIRQAQAQASAQPSTAPGGRKPNIILILSDDFGYGDGGAYGGGEGRGMPTPSLDRLAAEGMTFYSFYGQPSCTPGRAAGRPGASLTAAA
jgi:hypothetical protein